MQFVLHSGEEQVSQVGLWVVVDTGGKDIRHLLVKVAFAATDIADSLQQFAEIATAIPFQSNVIQSESFLDKLVKMQGGPLAETGSHLRFHTVTHGDYHIQIVMADMPVYASGTLLAN